MNICSFALNMQEETTEGAALGGLERASSLFAKELRHRGHRVEFYSIALRPLPHLIFASFFPLLSKRARSERARFHQFLKEKKIDIVVCQGGGWRILFLLKNLPCKLIAVWHNVPIPNEKICADGIARRFHSRWVQRFIRCKPCRLLIRAYYKVIHSYFFSHILNQGDKFVLLSEEFFADFALGEKFPTKVCAIPNIAPYEAQNVSFDKKKKELLWLNRVVFIKRPDYLLHIWQRLQDHFPDWSLRFVGDGEYLPELKKLSSSLGLKNVSFEGFQDPAPYYRSASIFCMTSTNEGFPNVLLEAQAFGCVLIAFESFGSVRDIIKDGVNGFLVPPFDLDIYAEKLAQLMSDPELRVRLGSAAQESIAKFSPEAVGDKWEKLLIELGQKM